jgi:hypothetical protein
MFENVQFFSHLHLKYAKSAIMTQNIFFFKNNNLDIKKRRILCWFQIRWCRLKQMPLKKLEPKNYANFEYFRFLLLTFVMGIYEILRFFDTHIYIFQEKNLGHNSTFCIV